MRRVLDLLTWVLMTAAVSAVFYLSTAPDSEGPLGVPACVGTPHAGHCRLCANRGKGHLPRVITRDNLRLVPTEGAEAAGKPGF